MKKWIILTVILLMTPLAAVVTGEQGMDKMKKEKTKLEKAIFAGGCFWCMEPPFEKLEGVHSVISGYIGGSTKNPTYREVSSGRTGHTEAIEIRFDPNRVSYEKLLDVLWLNIDPTDAGGQFVDRGSQYRSGIFYLNAEQKELAEKSKTKLENSGRFDRPVVTEISKAEIFYPAEDYHQDYYKTHPFKYKFYRSSSGRDRFIERVWNVESW